MKIKHIKTIFLVMCVLILSGCQFKGTSLSSQEEMQKDSAEDMAKKYQYSENQLEGSKVDGKMAVYFLRGDYAFTNVNGEEEPTGEATLLLAPDGTSMLVDLQDNMINGSYIAEMLKELGIKKLDYVVLTSPHSNHLGGYSIIMHTVEVGQIITNHHENSTNVMYTNLMKEAKENDITVSNVFEGDKFSFGEDVIVEVFNPAKEYVDWKGEVEQQNGALLLKFTYNRSSFLIGGDITSTVEQQLIENYGEKLQSDVVKMNRQGSKDSNSKEWIKTLNAKIAVGECNVVDNDIVVGRYTMNTEATLHTAIDGTCLIYTAGDGKYEVQVEKERVGDTYATLETENGYFKVQ